MHPYRLLRRIRVATLAIAFAANMGAQTQQAPKVQLVPPQPEQAPQPGETTIIQRVDGANENRYAHVLSFTDTEHYAVFRGNDETHPAAEMTVKMTYEKGKGKNYEIVSKSGSTIIQKFGLEPLLENEKQINDPSIVKDSWFASANY